MWVADRRYANPRLAMGRFMEIARILEAQNCLIPIDPITRTMLVDGASLAEVVAARQLAVAEGLIEIDVSGGYFALTQLGAQGFT
jgi:hypothetical protein